MPLLSQRSIVSHSFLQAAHTHTQTRVCGVCVFRDRRCDARHLAPSDSGPGFENGIVCLAHQDSLTQRQEQHRSCVGAAHQPEWVAAAPANTGARATAAQGPVRQLAHRGRDAAADVQVGADGEARHTPSSAAAAIAAAASTGPNRFFSSGAGFRVRHVFQVQVTLLGAGTDREPDGAAAPAATAADWVAAVAAVREVPILPEHVHVRLVQQVRHPRCLGCGVRSCEASAASFGWMKGGFLHET